LEVNGFNIQTIPAYNNNKTFHKRINQWVGYVVEIEGARIYHAGDTDLIEELKELKNIDIALLPVGGTYTMDAKEAARAVDLIKPKIAIPMHYGKIVGDEDDAILFQKSAHCEVKILSLE
jgi:L-ascorbate metabolism protein UlaG (beta-lactamase superfamily)